VEALHGIGPRQADALHEYGIHTVGLLAAVDPATVQRLLGGRTGRTASDHARGIDPRPVVPRALPATATVRHTFPHHTLDGGEEADGVDAVLVEGVGLAGADAVQGLHRQRGEPAGCLCGGDGEDAAGCPTWAEAVAATVTVGPVPTRTSTPRRDRVRTRSISPSRRVSVPW
jgi:hypothetical protein